MTKRINKKIALLIFCIVVIQATMLSPIGVTGQSSTGKIEVFPSTVQLGEGESKTIEIRYDSPADVNPRGIEFDVNYDPEVISVSVADVNYGEYLSGGLDKPIDNVEDGTIELGRSKTSPSNAENGTVATIEIELADGVNKGDTTDISITNVIMTGNEVPQPATIGGTVEAAEAVDKTPQPQPEYNVKIKDPTISNMPIGNSPSKHRLNFTVTNISTDGEPDNFSVTLPSGSVTVEDITETTVTDSQGVVDLTSPDPASASNPGNEINFSVDPTTGADPKTLTVEVEMKLSATS